MTNICEIKRAENGWVVTLHERHLNPREVLCLTWTEVEQVVRKHAFPFVDETEPRK